MSAEKVNEQIGDIVDQEEKGTKKKVIVISTVVTVCVAGIIILLLLLGKSPEEFNVVVTPEDVEDAIRKLNESEFVPIGSYEVVMNTDWNFPDGSSASDNAHVENCINNQSTVYFTIELADGTKVYTSPYLEVGQYIENIKLDQPLTAGTYDTVLTYHLVDSEHKETSHVSVSVTLTIQK